MTVKSMSSVYVDTKVAFAPEDGIPNVAQPEPVASKLMFAACTESVVVLSVYVPSPVAFEVIVTVHAGNGNEIVVPPGAVTVTVDVVESLALETSPISVALICQPSLTVTVAPPVHDDAGPNRTVLAVSPVSDTSGLGQEATDDVVNMTPLLHVHVAVPSFRVAFVDVPVTVVPVGKMSAEAEAAPNAATTRAASAARSANLRMVHRPFSPALAARANHE